MVMKLQLKASTIVNPQAKLPFPGLPSGNQITLSKLSSSLPTTLFVSDLQQSQYPRPRFLALNQNVAAIVFGDGSESRLYPLTKRRSEGAIPIAANYRLVDAVVSNCINSNINKVYALTQFNSTSLNYHLSRAYCGVSNGTEGFVEVIAAYQSPGNEDWFQGSADAVRRCLWVLEEYPVSEFLVLPGHHLYKMDYQKLIEGHRKSKADITIVASSATRDQDPGFGLLKVNSENQVVQFSVKSRRTSKSIAAYDSILPGMGIYLINRDKMTRLVSEYFPRAKDFSSEVIPGAISIGMKVKAYVFDGYWEHMKSIKAFYEANMECIKNPSNMKYNFYDRDVPVYTMPRYLPPTLVGNAVITNSVIGDGCILNGCKIEGSVVGMRTRIEDGVVIEDSVIMGSDIYEKEDGGKGKDIPMGIGDGSMIKKAIVDKNARVGKNVMIINKDKVEEGGREADGYIISGGLVVVLRGATLPDNTIL